MKVVSVLLIVLVCGCASPSQVRHWNDGGSDSARVDPCADPRFVALRKMAVDSMSMKQYDSLRRMEDACTKYQTTIATEQKEEESTHRLGTSFLIIGLVALICAGLAFSIKGH